MMREELLRAGVANLREFGFPRATQDNILTDEVYKAFFLCMLQDNKGKVPQADPVIDELISEIERRAVAPDSSKAKRAGGPPRAQRHRHSSLLWHTRGAAA